MSSMSINYIKIKNIHISVYDRLKVLKNNKPKQFALVNKYFNFLGTRTKLEEKDRYKLRLFSLV